MMILVSKKNGNFTVRNSTYYDLLLGVMNIIWHPHQPWLFSAGADSYIKLWT